MSLTIGRLHSPSAVQAALDEYASLGQTAFLQRYGFGKSRDFLVRNPKNGELCDSKAIGGAAYGFQFPADGPLKPSDFSGGEATVVAKLQALGFEVIRIGEDWSQEEVEATVVSYFEMLALEAQLTNYKKTEFNAALRQRLRGRSKASVELKHQNVSAVLGSMGLPFIAGYKPRSNAQLLLRKAVQQYVMSNSDISSLPRSGSSRPYWLHLRRWRLSPAWRPQHRVCGFHAKLTSPRATSPTGRWGGQESSGCWTSSSSGSSTQVSPSCSSGWTGSRAGWGMALGSTSCPTIRSTNPGTSKSRPPTAPMPRHSSSAATSWTSRRKWAMSFTFIGSSPLGNRRRCTGSAVMCPSKCIWRPSTTALHSGNSWRDSP